MKRLFHFILSHSIFISFCAVALSVQTLVLLNRSLNIYLLALIFFYTLIGYNAYWIISKISFNNYQSPKFFLIANASSLTVIITAIIGAIFCAGKVNLLVYNLAITLILLCLYAIPLLPLKQLYFTRKFGFLKTVLLAFAWTIATTLIPLQLLITNLSGGALLVFVNRFVFMLVLCTIFDKRDVAVDKIRGLQSLATDISLKFLNYLIACMLLAYVASGFFLIYYGISPKQCLGLIFLAVCTICIYIRSLQTNSYIFYYFLVDGLMFLSGLVSLLMSI